MFLVILDKGQKRDFAVVVVWYVFVIHGQWDKKYFKRLGKIRKHYIGGTCLEREEGITR